VLNYGSGPGFTWEGFFSTDRNADSTVIDMYSPVVRRFNGFGSVSGMHIEHSLPKSWWGAHENNAYKDLFHLYPADGATNSLKNNLPLGEVAGTPTFDNTVTKIGKNGFGNIYTESCFEPADEYKGDFARSYFYIATIYQDLSNLWDSPMMSKNTYPVWTPWAKDLLLKWHRQDPVSEKERARNNAVEAHQKNRNPFIDYPMLAEHLWGNKKGVPWSFTSGVDALKIEFSIGPNPVQNKLNIRTDEHDMTCSIFDLNGRLLMEKSLPGTAELAVDMLENGMYLIKLTKGERNSIQKFIISK